MSDNNPSTAQEVCVVCKLPGSLVKKCDVASLKDRAKCLADLGDADIVPLSDYLCSLPESYLEKVKYHATCRWPIMHQKRLSAAEKDIVHQIHHCQLKEDGLVSLVPVNVLRDRPGLYPKKRYASFLLPPVYVNMRVKTFTKLLRTIVANSF